MNSEFANKLADTCHSHYQKLGKKGKPIPTKEWTLLSAIVLALDEKLTVVAMATGTKCLGRSGMSPRGDLVNDSHAEVLARRCFLRYMYDQISNYKYTGCSDIIIDCNEKNQYVINPKAKFHFYSSHVPCGDASIIPKVEGHQTKRKCNNVTDETAKRKRREVIHVENDMKDVIKKGCSNAKGNKDFGNAHARNTEEECSTGFKGFIKSYEDGRLNSIPQETKLNEEILVSSVDIVTNHVNVQSTKTHEDNPINFCNRTENNQKCYLLCSDKDVNMPNRYLGESSEENNQQKFCRNFNCVDHNLRLCDHCVNKDKQSECKKICEGYDNFKIKESCEELEDCVGELVVDIHRTGAKCVAGEDKKLPGALYHVVTAVRTKPGRGDPTLSVSCSDKLARWIACGLQGALLSILLNQPATLESIVIGGGGPYSQDVLHRALIKRTSTNHSPNLLQSSSVFPHSRYTTDPAARPCPSAILWSRVSHKSLEVGVEGRRQGATKKSRDNGRLMVCKLELLSAFLSLSGDKYKGMTYRNIKASAEEYNNLWARVRNSFGIWTSKPQHLEDFTLKEVQ